MKEKNKKKIGMNIKRFAAVAAVAMGMLGSTVTSYAEEGRWKQDTAGWWFEFSDGSYAKQMWLSDGRTWYAFGDDGYMLTGWWKLDGSWYYFQPDGAMYKGWLKETDDTWYYLSSSGAMYTGWMESGGAWYYLNPNGAMAEDTWIGGYYVDGSGVWIAGKEQQAGLSEKITAAIDRMREKYPEGAYWNHMGANAEEDYSSMVTEVPCEHEKYGMEYCNSYVLGNVRGYQCDGFARKLSDEVFGSTAGRVDYAYDFDKIKIGDYLRYSSSQDDFISGGHSVFVIGKTETELITAEANYGGSCKIRWDGTLTREYLDSVYAECFTRY